MIEYYYEIYKKRGNEYSLLLKSGSYRSEDKMRRDADEEIKMHPDAVLAYVSHWGFCDD